MGKHFTRTELVIGQRVFLKRLGSRGTYRGRHTEDRGVVDFDDGGPQNVYLSSIAPLGSRNLLREERFREGQQVVDLATDRFGVVGHVMGDRVMVLFGKSHEVVVARHLQRIK